MCVWGWGVYGLLGGAAPPAEAETPASISGLLSECDRWQIQEPEDAHTASDPPNPLTWPECLCFPHVSPAGKEPSAVCVCVPGEGELGCELNGVTYQEGQAFQPSCHTLCRCSGGGVTCVPACPLDVRRPTPDCPNPQLVRLPGKCCKQWVCEDLENSVIQDAITGGCGSSSCPSGPRNTSTGSVGPQVPLVHRFCWSTGSVLTVHSPVELVVAELVPCFCQVCQVWSLSQGRV